MTESADLPLDALRARLTQSRDDAMAQLRRLGVSPKLDDNARRAGTDRVLDEGDEAHASERQDVAYATRERLAARIKRLTAALGRIHEGRDGRCTVCGGVIGRARLEALPEAETCCRCQKHSEYGTPRRVA